MASDTITTQMVISKDTAYCTEDQFRNETGFTDTTEFTSADIGRKIIEAVEKVKRDVFVSIRLEFTTKDSNDRYFISRRWLANAYGSNVSHGTVTPLDLRIWESDETSSISSAFFLQGSRINRLIHRVPSEGISEIDSVNGYFKLTDDWPSSTGYRIFADYWMAGKPLHEIETELKFANIIWTEILILEEKKGKRMKNGVISISQGGRTITRSEAEFNEWIRDLYQQYQSYVNWCRPYYGKNITIGRFGDRRYGYFPRTGRLSW